MYHGLLVESTKEMGLAKSHIICCQMGWKYQGCADRLQFPLLVFCQLSKNLGVPALGVKELLLLTSALSPSSWENGFWGCPYFMWRRLLTALLSGWCHLRPTRRKTYLGKAPGGPTPNQFQGRPSEFSDDRTPRTKYFKVWMLPDGHSNMGHSSFDFHIFGLCFWFSKSLPKDLAGLLPLRSGCLLDISLGTALWLWLKF